MCRLSSARLWRRLTPSVSKGRPARPELQRGAEAWDGLLFARRARHKGVLHCMKCIKCRPASRVRAQRRAHARKSSGGG